eukprot:Rhum_TRINITY_DN13993_c0_g3::Rhum_TRINITY_DN13993_c0_g3_i1::g.66648::m.66648
MTITLSAYSSTAGSENSCAYACCCWWCCGYACCRGCCPCRVCLSNTPLSSTSTSTSADATAAAFPRDPRDPTDSDRRRADSVGCWYSRSNTLRRCGCACCCCCCCWICACGCSGRKVASFLSAYAGSRKLRMGAAPRRSQTLGPERAGCLSDPAGCCCCCCCSGNAPLSASATEPLLLRAPSSFRVRRATTSCRLWLWRLASCAVRSLSAGRKTHSRSASASGSTRGGGGACSVRATRSTPCLYRRSCTGASASLRRWYRPPIHSWYGSVSGAKSFIFFYPRDPPRSPHLSTGPLFFSSPTPVPMKYRYCSF